MKNRRYNAKRDESEPDIVEKLEKAGWEVHRELPVDLLCMKLVTAEQLLRVLSKSPGVYLLALPVEVKTPQGKAGKARVRKEQVKQNEFVDRWRIPKPTTAFEALLALGEKVSLQ